MSNCDISVIWGNMFAWIHTLTLHERVFVCTYMSLKYQYE